MCTQGMVWDLLYILQINKPRIFQELLTKVHDIEVIVPNRRNNSFSVAKSKKIGLNSRIMSSYLRVQLRRRWSSRRAGKDRAKFKKTLSSLKVQLWMTISKVELVWIMGRPNPEEKSSPLGLAKMRPIWLSGFVRTGKNWVWSQYFCQNLKFGQSFMSEFKFGWVCV